MPKVFLNDEDRACHRFVAWVQGQKKLYKVNDTELADELGIKQPCMSRKLRLESFSFKDFVFLARKFGMDKSTFDYIIGD